MQRAVGPSSPLDWTEPSEMPVWEPWERSDDVLSYDPYTPPAPSTTEETTTEEQPAEDQPADEDSGDQSESPPPPPASPD
jgi:hypothetical protein